jgi:hypothetical protein
VRIVFAAVLAAVADTVLIAHHLPKHGSHLVTTRHVEEKACKQETRERKKRDGAKTLSKQVINNSEAAQQERRSLLCVRYLENHVFRGT